ncbi:hypothetical protein QBC43DRAFT_312832 [Cladorrhinum sp. PSN259]|nr:hypothetical protein QBC43DRAFT_312832 [Cladorrhinum sp. PSN259]
MRPQTLLLTGILPAVAQAFVNPDLPARTVTPVLNARQATPTTDSAESDSTINVPNFPACTSSIDAYISGNPHPELDSRVASLFTTRVEENAANPTTMPGYICSDVNFHIYAPPPRVKIPKSLTEAYTSFSRGYLHWAFKAKTDLSSIATRCMQEHTDTRGAFTALLMAATDIPSCREAFKHALGVDDRDFWPTGTSSAGAFGAKETGMAVMGAVAAAGVAVMGAM